MWQVNYKELISDIDKVFACKATTSVSRQGCTHKQIEYDSDRIIKNGQKIFELRNKKDWVNKISMMG